MADRGAPLYRIEKGLFEAAIKQPEGALEGAKSAKVLTKCSCGALRICSRRIPALSRDQALASDQQAKGTILEAEAALQTAQINLSHTDIISPIAGRR